MARPTLCRFVKNTPNISFFKPQGIPMRELEELSVNIEGLEALRLADMEGLNASQAAEQMRISRHTFGRLLAKTRRVVAEALVEGKAIRIEGGNYALHPPCLPEVLPISKERKMTMIAVSSEGPMMSDMLDPRFGRAGGFVLINPETMETQYIDNGASQCRAQGAGIETAERVCEAGATIVLSGYVGPKAFAALTSAGVSIYQDLDGLTVQEAFDKYQSGSIEPAIESNKV